MKDEPSSSVSIHPTVGPDNSNNHDDGSAAAAVAAAKAAARKVKRMKSLLNRKKKSVHYGIEWIGGLDEGGAGSGDAAWFDL